MEGGTGLMGRKWNTVRVPAPNGLGITAQGPAIAGPCAFLGAFIVNDIFSPNIDEQKRFLCDFSRYIAKLLRNSITLDNCQHKLKYLLIIFAEKQQKYVKRH